LFVKYFLGKEREEAAYWMNGSKASFRAQPQAHGHHDSLQISFGAQPQAHGHHDSLQISCFFVGGVI
jgi:hypothetical protein